MPSALASEDWPELADLEMDTFVEFYKGLVLQGQHFGIALTPFEALNIKCKQHCLFPQTYYLLSDLLIFSPSNLLNSDFPLSLFPNSDFRLPDCEFILRSRLSPLSGRRSNRHRIDPRRGDSGVFDLYA